jgi:hypothetical protein
MLNPFDHPAFSMTALSAAINILPNSYDRLGEMGLFADKPQRFRQIAVEEQHGVLTLLPTMAPGSPGTLGMRGKRKLRSFTIPHIPHDDVVLPQEVQGIRAFGSETEMVTIAGIMADHLQTMRNKHAITLEHLRFGALKGEILDADGSVLYNLFDEFGIPEPTPFVFHFTDPKADIKKTCLSVLRSIEDNLHGERCTGLQCFVGETFFDALTSHPTIKEAYNRWQDGQALRSDMRNGFPFGGLTFEEHRGRAWTADGVEHRFVDPSEGHAFPLGTLNTFATYYAPADFNETANTIALPLYAKQEPRKFERGTDLHTQSNPLPLCHRPAVLVKLVMG